MAGLIGKAFGPYKVMEKIGEGGMAVVYKGFQESLNRNVAIKVLRTELARDQQFIDRFRREALAVAKLAHPNILHVYDAGAAHGVYYIVMDYVDGGSLKDLIARGPMETDRVVTIATQLADALDYAHRQGLVHRDIKPSNILLTRDGRPLITDFGIAKALYEATQLTRTGTSIGTPEYMAPEQIQGQQTDGRTDIYALGIVIYEMITGRVPFSAQTPVATLYRQVNEPPAPLRQLNIGTPAWLEAIVERALEKRPDDRFRRAKDMVAALRDRAAPAEEPAAAPPHKKTPRREPQETAPPAERKRSGASRTPQERTSKRNPVPILVGAISVLIIALATILAVTFLGGKESDATATPVAAVTTAAPQIEVEASPTATPEIEVEAATPDAVETEVGRRMTATALAQPTDTPTTPPTSTPPPTYTPLPTYTPAPTSTPLPTNTPRPAPKVPTPTKPPAQKSYPPPVLLSPEPNVNCYTQRGCDFSWSWGRSLEANEYFQVQVIGPGNEHRGIHPPSKEYWFQSDDSVYQIFPDWCNTSYYCHIQWTVAIVEWDGVDPGKIGRTIIEAGARDIIF